MIQLRAVIAQRMTLLRPRHSNLGRLRSSTVLPGLSPITSTSPSSEAHRKSGPFAPPALPGLNARTTLSDSRHGRRLEATLRPLPSHMTGLPRLPEPPFREPTTPADRASACVDCFLARTAFPKWQEGRHPHCHFRGRRICRRSQAVRASGQPLARGAARGSLAHPPTAMKSYTP